MGRELLFKAQRVHVILVVVGLNAELAVAEFSEQPDGRRIVLAHFEAHVGALAVQRALFGRLYQQGSDAQLAALGQDRDGVQPRQGGAGVEQDDRVAAQSPLVLGHQGGGVGLGEQVTEAAPRQAVRIETGILDLHQRIDVPQRRGTDHPESSLKGGAGALYGHGL